MEGLEGEEMADGSEEGEEIGGLGGSVDEEGGEEVGEKSRRPSEGFCLALTMVNGEGNRSHVRRPTKM